jgi:prophage regulatory protein
MRQFCPFRGRFLVKSIMVEQKISNAGVFLRLPQVLERFPVCKSKWWAGVKSGRYPASIKLSENTTVWHSHDIEKLIEQTLKKAGRGAA